MSEIVEPFTVAGFIASLNVTVGATVEATEVAPPAGLLPVTIGGVTSGAVPVVNAAMNAEAIVLPAASAVPETLIVYEVPNANVPDEGMNDAVLVTPS